MLGEIIVGVREDLEARKIATPIEVIKERAQRCDPARSCLTKLRTPGVAVIAEVKRRSPS